MPCTYTYLHSSAQHNSTYHAQTRPTTTHSCEQDMYCTHSSVWSVELWASAAAMCCAPSAPMELYPRLYAHVYVRRAIQRTFVAHDARSHTYNRERGHIHPYVYADISNTNTRACPCPYTYLHSSAQRNSTYHAHYYALMRAGYALHSRECLECGVVGKCCSNVLRSLCAYGVVPKAVRTCV
jgi:hypothetical protein